MLKHTLAANVAALTTLASAHAGMPLAQWTGGWIKNVGELESIAITDSGGALSVSVKGQCSPNPCDWGAASATAYSDSAATAPSANTEAISATFDQGFAIKTVVLDGRAGDTLRAHVYTHFTDKSARKDYVLHASLKRAQLKAIPGVLPQGDISVGPQIDVGPIPQAELKSFKDDCISFNPGAVTVEQKKGSWKLVEGDTWMLDAGTKKSEMDRAKTIVQHYGFTKQCYVGRPDPSVEYWLVGNAPPAGALAGEDCVTLDPNALTIHARNGKFVIGSAGVNAAFSTPTRAEAELAIKVIKYYGFTKSCFVGRPDASMRYLRK